MTTACPDAGKYKCDKKKKRYVVHNFVTVNVRHHITYRANDHFILLPVPGNFVYQVGTSVRVRQFHIKLISHHTSGKW